MEQDEASQLHDARLLASIVESSDDAIISKSLDGIIQSWNAAAERLFGYTAEQAVGRHISLVIPPDRIAEEDHIIASLKAGRADRSLRDRARCGRTAAVILVSLTISPIKDDDGTRRRRVEDRARHHRAERAEAEREKFVTLVENSTDFIGMCDLKAFRSSSTAPAWRWSASTASRRRAGAGGVVLLPGRSIEDHGGVLSVGPGTRATARSRCASGTSRPARRAGWPTRC